LATYDELLGRTYAEIGAGWWPVIIFLAMAILFHLALRYTRYGKFTYAIGANPLAARVSATTTAPCAQCRSRKLAAHVPALAPAHTPTRQAARA